MTLTLLCLAAAVHAQNPAPLIVDGDGDGVSDEMDDCPYTPLHTPVDARGCPIQGDADGDGVPDAIDDCPYTPKGARVDAHGCALDSDFDGVPDGIDQCPNTPLGERVDETGCMPGERAGRVKAPAVSPPPAPAKPTRSAPRSTTSKALDATLDAALSSAPPTAAAPPPSAPAPVAVPEPAPATAPPPPMVAETHAVPATVPPVAIEPPAAAEPPPVAEPPVVASVPAAELPPLPSALSATLVTLDFPPNSMELSEAGFGQLRETARRIQSTLAANPGTHVLVEGHSLKAESAGLDHQRALLVRAFLMSRGVNADDVSTQSPDEPTTKANGRQVRVRLTPPATATP